MMKKILHSTFTVIVMVLLMAIALPQNTTTAEAAKIKLNKKTASLLVDGSLQLKVKGTSKKVKWSSSNKKIATVSSKGKVKAKATGEVVIKAKVGKKTLKCEIIVQELVLWWISRESIRMNTGNQYQMAVIGTEEKVIWKSSDESVASVDENGMITANGKGECVISATLENSFIIGDLGSECRINVMDCLSSNVEALELKVGETKEVTFTCDMGQMILPEGAEGSFRLDWYGDDCISVEVTSEEVDENNICQISFSFTGAMAGEVEYVFKVLEKTEEEELLMEYVSIPVVVTE